MYKSREFSRRKLNISYSTTEGTACKSVCFKFQAHHTNYSSVVDGRDFNSTSYTNDTTKFTYVGQAICIHIPILDNMRHDGRRFFFFGITSDRGINIWLQIFIWDDERGTKQCKVHTFQAHRYVMVVIFF